MAWHEEVEPDRIVFTGDLTEELRRVQINKYIFYGDNNNYDIQSTKKMRSNKSYEAHVVL